MGQDAKNWRVTPKARARARSLRHESTRAEQIIWAAVRAHRLNGASFRRQVPIGSYITDFVCHAANLVIEIDGGQHFESENLKKDARRDAFLRSEGFHVLRVTNHEVMTNRAGVLSVILADLERHLPPPQPSPAGGGGSRKTVP
jgi:very-short-patch-repair endonuclease